MLKIGPKIFDFLYQYISTAGPDENKYSVLPASFHRFFRKVNVFLFCGAMFSLICYGVLMLITA